MLAGQDPPPLVPHRNQAAIADLAFTILRYVFVDDDNMLPQPLRVGRRLGVTQMLNSHRDALVFLGKRYTYEELFSAWDEGGRRISVEGNVQAMIKAADQIDEVGSIRNRFAAAL